MAHVDTDKPEQLGRNFKIFSGVLAGPDSFSSLSLVTPISPAVAIVPVPYPRKLRGR